MCTHTHTHTHTYIYTREKPASLLIARVWTAVPHVILNSRTGKINIRIRRSHLALNTMPDKSQNTGLSRNGTSPRPLMLLPTCNNGDVCKFYSELVPPKLQHNLHGHVSWHAKLSVTKAIPDIPGLTKNRYVIRESRRRTRAPTDNARRIHLHTAKIISALHPRVHKRA